MKYKLAIAIGLVSLGSSAMWLVACSSNNNTLDGGGDDSSTGMDSTNGNDTSMDSNTMDQNNMDTGIDAGECVNQGADGGCLKCCRMNHPQGVMVLNNAIHSCECGNNGKCQQVCMTTYCAPDASAPNMACNTCVGNSLKADGGCIQQVSATCGASTECVNYFKCFTGCP